MDSLINRLFTGISIAMLLALSGAAHSLTLDPTTAISLGSSGTWVDGPKSYPWELYDCLSCSPSGIDTYFVGGGPGNLGEDGLRGITGDNTLTLSYKDNVGGVEEGSFASSYQTTYMNTPADPMDATIDYIGGAFIDGASWLEVKDGNHNPFTYLFNIGGLWDGMETITLNNFWPSNGAISHVAIWGGSAGQCKPGDPSCEPPTNLTEPGTLMLFGMGLIYVGLRRRLTN
jgi:hypothetical protein